MTSLFAQLFIALQKHITAEVPEIRFIDLDLGQLEEYEVRPTVPFPCVLIDFTEAQYSNLSRLQQWADITINIRLGFSPYSSSSSITPDVPKEKSLQFFEIENKLYKALHGFTADDCVQPLIRTSAATERREDSYRVRALTFTTATEDEEATLPINIAEAGLEVNGEINNED